MKFTETTAKLTITIKGLAAIVELAKFQTEFDVLKMKIVAQLSGDGLAAYGLERVSPDSKKRIQTIVILKGASEIIESWDGYNQHKLPNTYAADAILEAYTGEKFIFSSGTLHDSWEDGSKFYLQIKWDEIKQI
jgi:hypothetical protein